MYFKKSLSLITIMVFSFVFCLAIALNDARAQSRSANQGGDSGELATGTSSQGETKEDGTRTGSFYQSDTTTTGWGGVMTQWQFGPDVGYGETGTGYSYTDPRTGAYVSYQSTGMGMGAVPMPTYGGMFSQLGAASYGPWSGGQQYQPQATPGYDTQQSFGGSAFGQQYSYQQGQPNYGAMMASSLMQNPATYGLGAAMAYGSGGGLGFGTGLGYTSPGLGATALGSYGSLFSPVSTGLLGGFGSGLTSAYRPTTLTGGYGAYPVTQPAYASPVQSSYGYPVQSSYGYPVQSSYGYPVQSSYGYPNPYGSYLRY